MDLPIRVLTAADLAAGVAVLERAGLSGAVSNLARYLRWQPDGVWGATTPDGALAGMVSALHFGAAAFIGCMAVEPSHQRRGLGRQLLVHAHAAARRWGAETFLLEATPAGEPLYAQLGYVREHESVMLERPAGAAPGSAGLAAIPPAAREAVLAVDREATSTPRDAMIHDLLDEARGLLLPGGYGLVLADRIGPVLARDAATGVALIDALAPAARVCTVPATNAPALAALARHGYREVRRLARMRLGPPLPAPRAAIWALASPGAG